ncbi:helix-turn-helix transcriptional regulator [Natronomonas sp. EA1]|uniref:helix-turn-helix transcriptional regulator n=1 Tax=Natronomonas sp. EA1 TaxID=3421655 RepID=UPI003EB926E0
MRLSVLLVVLLLLVAPTSGSELQVQGVETITTVTLAEDGDATVSIELRFPLATEEERAAFDRYRADVEGNHTAAVAAFEDSARALVSRAERATGREMAVSNVSVETGTVTLPREWGVVTYRFDWAAFAVPEDAALRVEDVLTGYILTDDDALVVLAPTGYVVDVVSPAPDERESGRVVWVGPQEFDAGAPALTFVRSDNGPVDDPGDGPDTGTTIPFAGIGVGLLALALAGVAAGVYYRRRSAPAPASEMLSDGERVLQILEAAGGRVKQQRIVKETGWSETKVSKVTTELESQGRIAKLRIGRENVVDILTSSDGDGTPMEDGR